MHVLNRNMQTSVLFPVFILWDGVQIQMLLLVVHPRCFSSDFYLSCVSTGGCTADWWNNFADPLSTEWRALRENSRYPGYRVGSSARACAHTHGFTLSCTSTTHSLTLGCFWPSLFMVGLFCCVGVQTSRWHLSHTPWHPKSGRPLPMSSYFVKFEAS